MDLRRLMVYKDLERQKRNKAVLLPRTGSLRWGVGVGGWGRREPAHTTLT